MGGHPVDRHVGARLRALRIQRGLSQGAVAERVGLTFQQLQKYEKGTNRVSASKLFELAGILDVPVQEFFLGIAGDQRTRRHVETIEPSKLDIEIFQLSGQIEDGPVKRGIRDVLSTLAGSNGAMKAARRPIQLPGA